VEVVRVDRSLKTLDEIAALAVLAVYWQGLPKDFARQCEEDRIAIGDRALPTLLLAVSGELAIASVVDLCSGTRASTNREPLGTAPELVAALLLSTPTSI
jgi:hypothetical protein